MLNLSDKDLDRLSKEASGEYDPGDIVGPRSWEKLEMRLDRQLGRVTPHHVRGFYRLPFYYAPVVLLILGASYYFIRNHKAQKEASSGSPPLTLVKPGPAAADKPSTSSQNPTQPDKSTSTLVLPPATAEQPTAPAAGTGPGHDLTSGGSATSASATSASATSKSSASGTPAGSTATTKPDAGSTTNPAAAGTPGTANSGATTSATTPGTAASNIGRPLIAGASGKGSRSPHRHPSNGHDRSITSSPGSPTSAGLSNSSDGTTTVGTDNASTNGFAKGSASPSVEHLLSLSAVRGPVPTKRSGSVSDSALRAFTAKTMRTPIQRKGGTYVNRSLQIGLLLAPDFSSVNSMAGDKPGSSIGLTADYQFAHRWYVGTGLLLSRKNYAAAPQDYHVPKSYYSDNGMNNVNMNFIKGSFNMLEIPLNLRYDFSVTGNTLFFASAGLSSYVLTSESCNYYYQPWNLPRQDTKSIHYDHEPSELFSALDLSIGVEMGINNSLSVIVAPYVKVPVRNIGVGQVELSSVGINFVLEFTPVLSRKR